MPKGIHTVDLVNPGSDYTKTLKNLKQNNSESVGQSEQSNLRPTDSIIFANKFMLNSWRNFVKILF